MTQEPPVPSFADVPPMPEDADAEGLPPFPIPQHPDYELIAGILESGFDESMTQVEGEEPSMDINAWIANYVDPQSLSVIALQRTSGAFKFESPEQAEALVETLLKMSMLYTEAFVAGVKYGWMTQPNEGS